MPTVCRYRSPVSDCPEFDVEDRAIEVRVDDTRLAELAQEQFGIDDWPDSDQEWRDRWIDTVICLIDSVNRCDGLLTMTAPPGWRRPGLEIGYDTIADACSLPDWIAVHLRTTASGSEICSRRYFTVDDMQCLTSDGSFTDSRDSEGFVRGLVRDLEIEVNNLYRKFAG